MVVNLKQHTMPITALKLFPDDSAVYSASRDRTILQWDLRSETYARRASNPGRVLGCSCRPACLRPACYRRKSSMTQRMGGINSIALSKDQTNVYTVGQEKRITRWDLRDQNFLEAVDLSDDQTDEAACVSVSHSGHVVATGGTKKMLKLFETAPGHKLLATVVGHSGAIQDLKFSPDDKQLVTVGDDGVIFVWNLYVD